MKPIDILASKSGKKWTTLYSNGACMRLVQFITPKKVAKRAFLSRTAWIAIHIPYTSRKSKVHIYHADTEDGLVKLLQQSPS